MIQCRQCPSLAVESSEAIGIRREELGQHLDRHITMELGIARAVYLTHAARPERGGDFVVTKPGASRQRHRALFRMSVNQFWTMMTCPSGHCRPFIIRKRPSAETS